jgi:hypothetical protein
MGVKNMFLVPTEGTDPVQRLDLLSGAFLWSIPTTESGHLWLLWGIDEDEVGEIALGYGWDVGSFDWGLAPTFYWFNHLGEDGAFALGVQAKIGFSIPAGADAAVPAVFTVGWSRTIRSVQVPVGDIDYNILTFGLKTDFPIRR